MSSTHLSLYYHIIFSTKMRRACIRDSWEERLHHYLGGILRGLNGISKQIGGTADHVHILASLGAIHRLADVVRELKSESSKWVHEVVGVRLFGWQDGYGAFTVGKSQIDEVKQYIQGQKEHHRGKTFQEEYLELLRESGVDFDERFLW
ncbi:MAG TPA: IS200/IS605 family transposase [Acidobacteriota bacterium]|nr:IS200/IS605 family transposase [Acidobacteriota bacterium]